MRERLTIQRINKAAPPTGKNQTFIFDTESPRLAVRITKAGAKSFIFESKLNKKTIRWTIGPCYAWKLDDARAEANRLLTLVNQGIDPRELDQQEKAQIAAQLAEVEQARQEVKHAKKYTLKALCDSYTDHLDRIKKSGSAKDARSAFKVHIPAELSHLPAKEITGKQIAEIVRRVREKGKERTAGVLRSYLHAAYEKAMTAETDTAAPADLIPFQIESNPVHVVKAIAINAGERVLTPEELSGYLAALDEAKPVDRLLKVALLSGGQRIEQLLRATMANWDKEGKTLLLYDPKGKRINPRKHLLPLADEAAALMEQQTAEAKKKDFIFRSPYGGKIDKGTPGKRVKEIATSLGCERFDLRDIRRTCETRLAELGISKDTRAQLLSHGISGVQAKHYDRYEYITEKLAALEAWEHYLITGKKPAAKVIELAGRRATR
jgi:integrase